MSRLIIDPVTRIGGHLRIEAEVAGGVVTDAWSTGTMFRGLETILHGRDPRDAWLFAQRICGSCTGVQALASVRAVEHALGATIPRNARLVRNVMAGTQYVLDHVLHFYHLHAFDWVDVASALRADPAATSALATATSGWPQSGVVALPPGPGAPPAVRVVGGVELVRQRPVGPPGLPAVRRGEPAAGHPLPRRPRLAPAGSRRSTRSSAARTRTRRPSSWAAWP